MTTNPFTSAAPLNSDFFKVADNENALVIIRPLRFEAGVSTQHGPTDVLYCDIWAVDGPNAGEHWSDAWVTQALLTRQLKPKQGQLVIGRIGKGTPQPGKSAPWMLIDATETDMAAGITAWEKIQAGAFTKPSEFSDKPPF